MSATRKMWMQRLAGLANKDKWSIAGSIIAGILFVPLYIPRAFARKFGDTWSDMDSELQFVLILISVVICVLGTAGYFIYRSERTLSAAEVVAVTSKNACAALSVEKYLEENHNSVISAGRLSTFVDRCEPENLKNEYTRLMGEKK